MMPSNYHILCCPFPPCPQSFPVSWSSNELALCIRCQSIGASASASVLPMHIQSWFPLELTGLISFLSKGLSSIFSSTTVWSINSSALSLIYGSTLTFIPDYMSLWDPYNPTGVKPSNIYLFIKSECSAKSLLKKFMWSSQCCHVDHHYHHIILHSEHCPCYTSLGSGTGKGFHVSLTSLSCLVVSYPS